MNKKSIDKIDIFTLDVNYNSFMLDIFKLHNLDEFINNLNNEITEYKSINIYNRLLEYCWYVYMDEIIINKVKFIDFFVSLFIYLIFNNLLLDFWKKIFHSKENVLRVTFF